MAVQEIKTSQEYNNICNYLVSESLETQELCKTIKARKVKAEAKNV